MRKLNDVIIATGKMVDNGWDWKIIFSCNRPLMATTKLLLSFSMGFLRYCLTFKEHGFQIRVQVVYLIGRLTPLFRSCTP